MIGIGLTPVATLAVASRLERLADGSVTVVFEDDTVMSVQPTGAVEHRPAGACGPYERARVQGQLVVFRPRAGGPAFAFPYADRVP
tara:strand:- start:469 stop:726 length:258 start_codon:yes stop_codon:yes gene_type:complete